MLAWSSIITVVVIRGRPIRESLQKEAGIRDPIQMLLRGNSSELVLSSLLIGGPEM